MKPLWLNKDKIESTMFDCWMEKMYWILKGMSTEPYFGICCPGTMKKNFIVYLKCNAIYKH